jgi:hypothetical protein
MVMAYFGRSLGSNLLLLLMLAASSAVIGILMMVKKPSSALVIASSFQHLTSEPTIQPATKIVPIKNEAAVAEQ